MGLRLLDIGQVVEHVGQSIGVVGRQIDELSGVARPLVAAILEQLQRIAKAAGRVRRS